MIKLADVKNPQFEKDVKKALKIDGKKSYRELVKIQRRYKIKTPSHSSSTWAYMMAVFHNKVKPYVEEQSQFDFVFEIGLNFVPNCMRNN